MKKKTRVYMYRIHFHLWESWKREREKKVSKNTAKIYKQDNFCQLLHSQQEETVNVYVKWKLIQNLCARLFQA